MRWLSLRSNSLKLKTLGNTNVFSFSGIYGMYLKLIKENRKIRTCNRWTWKHKDVTMVTFGWHFLWIDLQILSCMMDEFIPLAKTSHVNNLWWNIVMDDWDPDEKSLGKWQRLQHCKSIIPQKINKEWQNNVGLTFSVGGSIPWLTISIEQGN